MKLVLKQFPNLAREYDYMPSLEHICGEAVKDLLDFDSDTRSSSFDSGRKDIINNQKLSDAQNMVNATKEQM